MTETTKKSNKKTSRQALFEAIALTLVCAGSITVSCLLLKTIAPLIGAIVVMGISVYVVFRRYFEIRKEEKGLA